MNQVNGTSSRRKIAIIGAGNVGLLYLRTFLKKGHDVTCFEQRSKVGGMWNFETKPEEEKRGYANFNADGSITCAYSQVALNTSKFTVFPSEVLYDEQVKLPDKQWLSGKEFLQALNDIAEKYNMMSHINFNTTVQRLDKVENGWKMIYQTKNEIKEEVFEFVACCSGGFRYPKMPSIKNMDCFKGCSIHSSQIRLEKYLFPGKTVLVVGSSFSGTDIVYYALKNGAKKVYWNETKNLEGYNHWMIDRCPLDRDPAKPFDLGYSRHAWFDKKEALLNYLDSVSTSIHKRTPSSSVMLPGDRFGVTGVSFLVEQEKLGTLQKVGPLESITEHGANLKSGSTINDVDLLIYCTGYETRYPIADHIWDIAEQKKAELYMNVLPIDKKLHGIAFAGASDAIVSKISVYELQARWLCHMWLNRNYDEEGKLFSDQQMKKMTDSIKQLRQILPSDFRFNHIPNVFALSDCMANDIGCLPPDYKDLIRKGTKKDVELGIALMKGPLYSVHYRIQGDDNFPKAAEFIVNLARKQLGKEKFGALVDRAMENTDVFFEKEGASKEAYVVQPYVLSIKE